MVQSGHSVAVAFALNIAAGFATIVGGTVVFHKRLVHLANPVSLAIALGVSAGVMVFISLAEIFGESVQLLAKGIQTKDMKPKTAKGHAWLAATGCFAAGIVLIYLIDWIVHKIAPEHEQTEMENMEIIRKSIDQLDDETNSTLDQLADQCAGIEADNDACIASDHELGLQSPMRKQPSRCYFKIDEPSRRNLQRMGLLSALAIGIHNIPEGVATYVGALQNSSVGFSLAIGIGLHNIPEGIAVAAPIYFATGSRWRGIIWCAVSAAAEPLGGLIAWLAIGKGMDPVSEGIMYGLVCGIMVCISVKELLPTAYKFAGGQTQLVSAGVFFGMFIMLASLILFAYAGV